MAWWRFWDKPNGEKAEKPDYYQEGVVLARQERFQDALTSFRLALRERADDVASMEQMAVVYTRIGLTDDAIKMYQRALSAEPDSPSANYGIAFVLLNRGDQEAAARHLAVFLEAEKPTGFEVEERVGHARATLERLQAEPRAEEPE